MRIWLCLGLGLTLLAAISCGPAASARPEPDPSHQLAMVFDLPCDSLRDQVRQTLRSDPSLGLAQESSLKHGVAFILPTRREGDRRWRAEVLVQCLDPLSTRLEVRVRTEKLIQGEWQPADPDPEMEKAILDQVLPKP